MEKTWNVSGTVTDSRIKQLGQYSRPLTCSGLKLLPQRSHMNISTLPRRVGAGLVGFGLRFRVWRRRRRLVRAAWLRYLIRVVLIGLRSSRRHWRLSYWLFGREKSQ